jgi:hypothetical protein
VVQLVECFLAKEEVVGSNPIARSTSRSNTERLAFFTGKESEIKDRKSMSSEIMNIYNLTNDNDAQESLRLALMFKEEIDQATYAFIEMLQMSINPSVQGPDEIALILREAINSALVTGIQTYRVWLQAQGIEVKSVEEKSGKDIPLDFFHNRGRYPL